MDLEQLRAECLALKGTSEDMPFGEDMLAFRVMGKIFLLTGINADPPAANMKCDPERAIELREMYSDIVPGYHMNKVHWNTVTLDALPTPFLQDLIRHSYDLVAASLKKAEREALNSL
jgi:predicted DNA-binding protein (MmcQ/YjbR family)